MPQNSLHDVERHLVFHQPRCQRVPQRVGIDLADLAAFGNRGQPDLKALGIEMRPGLGREQQPVRVRPCGICQREQMPDQKLTQAVRDRDLAVRRACLRCILDDEVYFLLRIVIQNLNVWILWRNSRCWNTDQIFHDRKRLLLQIQIRNFQRQHLADAESDKQGRQNRDALCFPHDLLDEDLHFRWTQDTHLRRDNFRPCRVNRGITRQLVFSHGVRKKVLQQHMLVLNGLCG